MLVRERNLKRRLPKGIVGRGGWVVHYVTRASACRKGRGMFPQRDEQSKRDL